MKVELDEETLRELSLLHVLRAVRACVEAEAEAERARHIRDAAIREAKAHGVSLRELSAITNLSKARVHQIAPGEPSEPGVALEAAV